MMRSSRSRWLSGIGAVVLIGGMVLANYDLAVAVVKEQVDYVFPDPNTEYGEPDPAVWTNSGNISWQPVEGRRLLLQDNGALHSLEYSHASSELANPTNASVFRATIWMPAQPEGAFSANGLIGGEVVLDDAKKRLILRFGRDGAGVRQLVIEGAAGVPAIPFPWDNNKPNVYEVGKLANGDYFVAATNGDPVNGDPPVTRNIPQASVPSTLGSAVFLWGMAPEGGGNMFWQEVHGAVFEAQTDIGLDTRRLELDLGEAEIIWKGEITLPPGVTLSPGTETMTITLANASGIVFEYSIPAGGFIQKNRKFRFESPFGASPGVVTRLRQRGAGCFRFKITVEAASLTVADRMSVTGTIVFSNKVGMQTVALTDRQDRLVFVHNGSDDTND